MDRRLFFKALAGAAALPILAKLPAPIARTAERVGAWATVQIRGGAITSISIISAGHGYTSPPTVTINHPEIGA